MKKNTNKTYKPSGENSLQLHDGSQLVTLLSAIRMMMREGNTIVLNINLSNLNMNGGNLNIEKYNESY